MAAKITGFRTRAQLQLRAPRSRSSNITPQKGGAAVHWGGPRQNNTTHTQCEATWRSWQRLHMAPGGLGTRNGAADIAYTAAFCNHGYVLAGRGFGTRTGANGSSFGNQNFYAFVWIGGSGQKPTQAAYDALAWLILEARTKNRTGRQVSPHSRFRVTSCCGPELTRKATLWHNRDIAPKPIPQPAPAPQPATPEWKGKAVRAKSDINFYRNPGWAPSNTSAGIMKAGTKFPNIHSKVKVGNGWQYKVTNSRGVGPFYVTASSKFVDLV